MRVNGSAVRAIVRTVTTDLRVLHDDDRIGVLDSLTMIELVAALEDASGIDLHEVRMTAETFATVASITDMLERAQH